MNGLFVLCDLWVLVCVGGFQSPGTYILQVIVSAVS